MIIHIVILIIKIKQIIRYQLKSITIIILILIIVIVIINMRYKE